MTTTIKIADKAINTTYQNKTGTTSGAGTGAKFDVTKTDGIYSVVLDTATGSDGTGYVAGDTITILGSQLGGVNTVNDLILTVATVGAGGKIATFGSVGTGRVGDGTVDIDINVTGSDAVDTYTFIGDSTDFTVTNTDGDLVVSSSLVNNLNFNLADHERLVFDDKAIAFDLVDGAAGTVYSLLGAGLGVNDITEEFIGAGLYYKDLGWTDRQLAQALLNTDVYKEDAGGVSDETFIKHVWKNVFGDDATLAEVNEVLAIMKNGNYTQADILVLAANQESFQTTIDLVGMQTTGVDYVPYNG